MNEIPISLKFCLFQATSSSPPLFFFNQNDSTVEYFCIDLKGFFYALIKFAFTHLTIPFFCVPDTEHCTRKKKKKEKKETHSAFALNCVKSFSDKARKVFGISLC